MDTKLSAQLKTFEDFKKSYEKDQVKDPDLLLYALANTNEVERIKISRFLLVEEQKWNLIHSEGYSALQILFAHAPSNLVACYYLAKELLAKGCPVDHKDLYGQHAFYDLLRMRKYTDLQKWDLYQLLLSRGPLPVLDKDALGQTLLDFAGKSGLHEEILEELKLHVGLAD